MTESTQQAYEKIVSQNRGRQKKFYDANKAAIMQKKKDDRAELKELRARFAATPAAAAAPPCNECAAATAPARPSRGKKGAKAAPVPKPTEVKYDLASVLARVKELVADKKLNLNYISSTKTLFTLTGCDTLTSCLQKFDNIKHKLETGIQTIGEKKRRTILFKQHQVLHTMYCKIDNHPEYSCQ